MMRALFLTFALTFIPGLTRAQQPSPPASSPPRFCIFHRIEKDNNELIVQETKNATVPKRMNYNVIVDGRVEVRVREVSDVVQVAFLKSYPLKNAKIINGTGKQVEKDDFLKQVKSGTGLLLAASEKVDPAYLAPLKKDSFVVMLADGGVNPAPIPQPKK